MNNQAQANISNLRDKTSDEVNAYWDKGMQRVKANATACGIIYWNGQ